jgi:hypothetical protein
VVLGSCRRGTRYAAGTQQYFQQLSATNSINALTLRLGGPLRRPNPRRRGPLTNHPRKLHRDHRRHDRIARLPLMTRFLRAPPDRRVARPEPRGDDLPLDDRPHGLTRCRRASVPLVLIADRQSSHGERTSDPFPSQKARMQRKNTVPERVVQAEMAMIKQPYANL